MCSPGSVRIDAYPWGMTRSRVAALLAEGMTITEIARTLALAKSTVCFHARTVGRPADPRFAVRYDWPAIRAYYETGASLAECRERFGFSQSAWHEAVRRGDVEPRPRARDLESLLRSESPGVRGALKRKLLEVGELVYACEWCEVTEWRGRAVSLQLHHVNGDGSDHRRSNLLLLCPNCHSQTDNYAGRNARRHRPAYVG